MQLDITKFVRAHRDHMDQFSNSRARSGLQNIGQITWQAAVECVAVHSAFEEFFPTLLDGNVSELVDHFAEYGAWSREDLEAMAENAEIYALLVQFIAGDFQAYTEAKEKGKAAFAKYEECEGGRLYGNRGRWYYYIGS
jgi:hypothetical protein